MISAEGKSENYSARIVQLICTDDHPDGPGIIERPVATGIDGTYPARRQTIKSGSFGYVEHPNAFASLQSFTVQVLLWPTLLDGRRQTLLGTWCDPSGNGFSLEVNEQSHLCFRIGDGTHTELLISQESIYEREWFLAAASFDAESGVMTLYNESFPRPLHSRRSIHVRKTIEGMINRPQDSPVFLIGAHKHGPHVAGYFDGKLEAPRLANRVLSVDESLSLLGSTIPSELNTTMIGAWDFRLPGNLTAFSDLSDKGLHGRLRNLPTRGVTGHNWKGKSQNWQTSPDEYNAIHFHSDDMSMMPDGRRTSH
jgi:N,N-dimethylformamidase